MKTSLIVFTVLVVGFAWGQHGVSSGSYTMFQANGLNSYNESGRLNERMIIVEDFVNYHKHNLKIPENSNPVLSIDFDNTLLNDRFILQVGLATPYKDKLEKTDKQVNVSLVIDNSGSMSGGKMEFVKNALIAFIKELEDGTNLSIIVFNSVAEIRQKNLTLTNDRSAIHQVIHHIYPSGSTNINSGMLLGYEEIMKAHKPGMNSRLILLTDGMTNTGEVNHEIILANSKKFNDEGIEISTIGVGQSIDFDLLRSLAENGRGSNHFIGDSEKDIQKVFINEVESLLYNLGKETKVTIELPAGFKIAKLYGYKPVFESDSKVIVNLENLNAGTTQVILMEVESDKSSNLKISASLQYKVDGKTIHLNESFKYNSNRKKSTQEEISKNYAIAIMADALKEYAGDFVKGSNPTKTKIEASMKFTENHADLKDEDAKRMYDLLKMI
ncbi:MAG: VWA domain-containing protein [Moheibacter sp.]